MPYILNPPPGLMPNELIGMTSVYEAPHYDGKDGIMSAMLRDIVSVIPCFSGMDESYEDAIGSMKFLSTKGDNALYSSILKAGVPLISESFPPFLALAGDDKIHLPSVRILLGDTDTFFMISEKSGGGGTLSLIYCWVGGKSYYKNNKDAMISLKLMVDKEALKAVDSTTIKKTPEEVKPVNKIAVAVERARAIVPETVSKASTGIKGLHDAGFVIVGTENGPRLMYTDGADVTWTVLPENDTSITKASMFTLLKNSKEGSEKISGIGVSEILRTIFSDVEEKLTPSSMYP